MAASRPRLRKKAKTVRKKVKAKTKPGKVVRKKVKAKAKAVRKKRLPPAAAPRRKRAAVVPVPRRPRPVTVPKPKPRRWETVPTPRKKRPVVVKAPAKKRPKVVRAPAKKRPVVVKARPQKLSDAILRGERFTPPPLPRPPSAREPRKPLVHPIRAVERVPLPPVFAAKTAIGNAMRDFLMAREKWDRTNTGGILHELKTTYRKNNGIKAWKRLYREIVDDYDLADYIYDYEGLRDT